MILKEKKILWNLRCEVHKKGIEMVKNKMLQFVRSIKGITWMGQEVISFNQIKNWYTNPETSELNKQTIFYDLFEYKEITLMTKELMRMHNITYINKELLTEKTGENLFVEKMRKNGWIGILLTRIVKSRRDCVSCIDIF